MSHEKQPRSLRALDLQLGLAGALAASLAASAAQAQDAGPSADQAAETARATASVSSVTVRGRRPNLTPHQDPVAPYKVDRSASGKLTEDLVDTPKTVTILTKDVVDDLGATNFRDLMRTQTGVTLGTGEGGNAYGDRIFIRGFEARNDVYIDGVRDPGVGAREVFGVEQFEILKGPNSTIGGRGTTGGAVSLISKTPLNSAFQDLEVSVGDDGTRRATLDLNQMFGDGGVRLNLMKHEGGVAGRNAVFNDRWGAALAGVYDLTDALRLSADYYHLTTDEMPDFGVPYDLANNRPFDIDRNNFYGVAARDFRQTFADIGTLKADYALSPKIGLHTLYRVGQTKNAYTASAPEGPNAVLRTVNANPKRRDAITDTWASQSYVDVAFDTGPLSHTLVAGFEASGEEIVNRGRAFVECAVLPCTGTGAAVVQNLDKPNPYVARGVVDNGVTSRSTTAVDTSAFYAIDTIKLGERWLLLAALRHDRYDIDFTQLTVATGAVTTRSNSTDFWNGNIGLTFKPTPASSLYAAYGTSSNPSGEQLDSTALDYGGLDPRTASLDPEENRSVEIGGKWNLAGEHLSLTAAAYQITKTNARVALNATTVLLAGEQEVKGFEVSAFGAITPRWQVFGGYNWMTAEITDSPTIAQIGAKFPNVPERSGSLTSKYAVTDQLSLGATVTQNSRRYGGTVTALNTSIPGFTRLDLFGTYRVNRHIQIDFNILNLTDEVYYDALYRSATPFTYIAPGRSMLIKFDYHF